MTILSPCVGAASLALDGVVHVIDDDPGLSAAIANLLASAGIAAALYSEPEAFLSRPPSRSPGCVLLDIQFPEGNGLDFQAELVTAAVTMPVILMTGHADVSSAVRGMKAGALDFLSKPFDDEALLAAVGAALARDAARLESETRRADVESRYEQLTSREREVMALVARGLMNKQVAGELELSEITVKVHRGTMMRKMAVRTVADLVRLSELLRDRNAL